MGRQDRLSPWTPTAPTSEPPASFADPGKEEAKPIEGDDLILQGQGGSLQVTDDPPGPKTGDVHIVRGGAFTNRNRFVRSADRNALKPGYRYNFTGFRVLRAVP